MLIGALDFNNQGILFRDPACDIVFLRDKIPFVPPKIDAVKIALGPVKDAVES
jgi:hypothetical protein